MRPSSQRLTALDQHRETFLVQLAPFMRYANESRVRDAKHVVRALDLATTDHWTDLLHASSSTLDVQAQIPLRETLLVMARRITTLEEQQQVLLTGKKKSGGSASSGTKKKARPESVWNESIFQTHRARQVTASAHLAALREGGKRGQVLAEVVDSECRYLNDLLVIKGIFETALREQTKRARPFISEEELEVLFPESLNIIVSVHEALYQKLSAFESDRSLMGPILAEFAVGAVRGYSDYVVAFEKMSDKLKEWTGKRPQLAEFLVTCKRHPQCNSRDLISLLVMPVQHIPKLQLLVDELSKRTPPQHADTPELGSALKAIAQTAQRVNTDKGKSDDFGQIYDICTNKLFECNITRLLVHVSQRTSGRRLLMHLKAMRYQGGANGSTEKIHIFVLSDVVLVAQRRFRDSKLTVSDYLWLCEAAPLTLLKFREIECFLLESLSMAAATPPLSTAARPKRTDFSLLFSVLSDEPLSRDELEQLRMQLNNAVAVCIDQEPPLVEGFTESVPQQQQSAVPSSALSPFASKAVSSARNSLRHVRKATPSFSASDGALLADDVVLTQSGGGATAPANVTPAPANANASPPVAASSQMSVPSSPAPMPLPGLAAEPHVSPASPLVASRARNNSKGQVDLAGVQSPVISRATSFMGAVGRKLRGKGGAAAQPVKQFGVALQKQWEQRNALPPVCADCVAELDARGATAEGVFRIPGSGDALKSMKRSYDAGEPVDLSEWDINTVASLLLLWIRELPEPLLPASSCVPLRAAIDEGPDAVRLCIGSNLAAANAAVLGALMRSCRAISLADATTKMTSENLAVCLTPDLVRVDNDPVSNLRSAAQFGRIVRYLIEGGGDLFVRPASPRSARESSSSAPPSAPEVATGKKGKKQQKELKAPKRPKDLPNMSEEGNIGNVIATADHVAGALDELSFSTGDDIIIHQLHPSGWWFGGCGGRAGIFPSSKTNAGGIVRPQQADLSSAKTKMRKVISPRARADGPASPRAQHLETSSDSAAAAPPDTAAVVRPRPMPPHAALAMSSDGSDGAAVRRAPPPAVAPPPTPSPAPVAAKTPAALAPFSRDEMDKLLGVLKQVDEPAPEDSSRRPLPPGPPIPPKPKASGATPARPPKPSFVSDDDNDDQGADE